LSIGAVQRNKNILMISQALFPPDIRLEKEIKSLSEAGFKVLVVCNQYDKNLKPDFNYCEINRVNAPFNSIKLNRIINFPIFFNPRYLIKVFTSIVRFKPGFIHAHDLPIVPLALFFGKLFSLPVIFDMHENYPEALKAFGKTGLINFIFKNYRAAKWLEKFCIKHSDAIITVVQENSDRLIKQGVVSKKINLVSNTVDLDTFATEPIDERIIEKYRNDIVLLYAGYVTPERGLDVVVKGMSFLKEKIPNAKLLIIGNGITVAFLKKISDELSLNNFMEFIEWPGHDKLASYFSVTKIFISPQPECEFWNTTIPHKLFEYMSKSKPVIAADSKAIKRVIEESKCGLTYQTGNAESFAEKAIEILSSNIPFGENGLKAVREKYNWRIDKRVLIKLYADFSHR
jgi:glycosyltransferase involved in cell wall biosynthesis